MFPDWKNTDLIPPTSQVYSLPEYTKGPGFDIIWGGTDIGSDIHGYSVQYRIGQGGSWTNLFVDHVDTFNSGPMTYHFSGVYGDTLFFQSRAIDEANNIEEYPGGNGDTFTKIFTYSIDGVVTDNRGNPLKDTSISILPASWSAVITDTLGEFSAYLIATGEHLLNMSKANFGSWADTTHNISSDTSLDPVYLPPMDNVVIDGDFEESSTSWSPGGNNQPITTSDGFLTGSNVLTITNYYSPPPGTNISDTLGSTESPIIVTDQVGSLHAVWVDRSGSPYVYRIFYAEKPYDGDWTEPVMINPTPAGKSLKPDITVDSNNNPHLTWVEQVSTNYYTMYSYRNSIGEWSAPDSPSGAFLIKSSSTSPAPEIEIDSLDRIHLIWNEHGNPIQYAYRPLGGIWSAKVAIPSSISNSSSHAMVIDSDDTLHIVATQLTTEGTKYYTRSVDGIWSTPVLMNSEEYSLLGK